MYLVIDFILIAIIHLWTDRLLTTWHPTMWAAIRLRACLTNCGNKCSRSITSLSLIWTGGSWCTRRTRASSTLTLTRQSTRARFIWSRMSTWIARCWSGQRSWSGTRRRIWVSRGSWIWMRPRQDNSPSGVLNYVIAYGIAEKL